ncbi:hypothetical protein [Kitasatospora sp. NPDC059327]|uniref:hypothetical protein n=1 Tax=Kitasatospora sp. NPDC059327 TaxID=3346803 RepID=UPI0036B80BDA
MLTEQLLVPFPLVVGLLNSSVANSHRRREALAEVLQSFCRERELELSTVITDDGSDPEAIVTSITGTGLYAVVLPTDAHLGSRGRADRRRQRLQAAGIRLMVVRGRQPARRRSAPDFGTGLTGPRAFG